jgi:hypothetical protein
MLGWTWSSFHKKHARTHYTELAFLHPMGFVGYVVHSGASDARWDQYGFDKKFARIRYAELVFLYLVRYACHVVHFGASGERNGDGLLSWSGGTGTDSTKSTLRYVTLNLCFCI